MAHVKKTFFLDTNVILHDSKCLYQFEENDIVLPIVILEELDNFKKGNESINFHAREFVRTLDSIASDGIFNTGAKIDKDLGNIFIRLQKEFDPVLKQSFYSEKADHRILNSAYTYKKEFPKKHVVIISKDVNLRMKAKSVGIEAQDYKNDHVRDLSSIYNGYRTIEYVSSDVIDKLYKEPHEISPSEVEVETELLANEHLIIRNGNKSALGYYNPITKMIQRVDQQHAYGIQARNAEQSFALSALLNDQIKLITITGKAGTGKTLLSMAAALEMRSNYRQVYISRPIVPLSNRDLGFLPGDVNAKLIPYMQPLYDNLGVIQNQFVENDKQHTKIKDMLKDEKIKIEPLSYIRGRSLVKIFFIVDEAQNLTPHEVKTIITRAGEGTKIVFTGDVFQIDHPYLDTLSNGLSYMIERMKGQDIFTHINLEKGERSQLAEIASNLL